MTVLLLTLALLTPWAGAQAAALVRSHPTDRVAVTRFEIEYLRPWADLPVQEGSLALGFPLGRGLRLGTRVSGLRAASVRETGVGVWLQLDSWLRAAVTREERSVQGLSSYNGLGVEADLAIHRSAWAAGAWFNSRPDPVRPLQHRGVWASLARGPGSLFVVRRNQVWTGIPVLALGIRLELFTRVSAGLRWEEGGTLFSLGWHLPGWQITAASVWNGPRAGAFGLRLAEGP